MLSLPPMVILYVAFWMFVFKLLKSNCINSLEKLASHRASSLIIFLVGFVESTNIKISLLSVVLLNCC